MVKSLAALAIVVALGGGLALGAPRALAQAPDPAPAPAPPASTPPCPVPVDQLAGRPGVASPNVDVCVDRGDNAVYSEGDAITVCVTVNLPTIMIYPPPQPPNVRVTLSTNGGPEQTIYENRFNGEQRCVGGGIEAPFGQDVFRARVLGPNGATVAEDVVLIQSQPR